MTPQLTPEQSVALPNLDNQPMHVADPATNQVYFVFDRAKNERAMDALRHRDGQVADSRLTRISISVPALAKKRTSALQG